MFRKRARGLFDLVMASMAVVTLLTTTPAGELMIRGARWALGMPGQRTTLISFFGTAERPVAPSFTAPEPTSALASVARAFGAEPSLLKGFALASATDPHAAELAMDLTPAGRELLVERGASEEDLSTSPGRLRAVSQALAALTPELGSPDAALCALVVGLAPIRYAAQRVRAERRDPSLEALGPHLPPTLRGQANQVVGLALALATAYDLVWPVARETRIASRFGARLDPLTGARSHHTGIDLSLPVGSKVNAAGQGVVKRAGEDGVNGRFVVLDHGRGITSCYCHNQELLVARGGRVTQGLTIARSGNTGRSTGPHLHYQVAIDGVPVDPLALFADSERALLASAVLAVPKPPPRLNPVPTTAAAKEGPSPKLLGAFEAAATENGPSGAASTPAPQTAGP
ncbi:MAG: M23 family metallopeptidase [Deltaproteobacteria bacterium]|nr:M23 family metallopeptidase [Deltaproteobacteria bacterium]